MAFMAFHSFQTTIGKNWAVPLQEKVLLIKIKWLHTWLAKKNRSWPDISLMFSPMASLSEFVSDISGKKSNEIVVSH